MTEQPATDSRRRTFVPALVVGLASAGLVAIAGNQAWVVPSDDAEAGSIGQVAAIAADASSPLTTAVALVLLACWGVVLVTRGSFRRVIAVLAAVAAVALLVVAVLGWVAAPDDLRDLMRQYGIADPELRRTAWSWVALAAAPVALAAPLLAVRDVRHWPQMGSRYDAPSAASGGEQESGKRVEEQSNLELWKSLDEGTDPTDR